MRLPIHTIAFDLMREQRYLFGILILRTQQTQILRINDIISSISNLVGVLFRIKTFRSKCHDCHCTIKVLVLVISN